MLTVLNECWLYVEWVTLRNGFSRQGAALHAGPLDGAAIFAGVITLVDCILQDNQADGGGGGAVYANGGNVTFRRTRMVGNIAEEGGVVYGEVGTVVRMLDGSKCINNTADPFKGGCICAHTVQVEHSELLDNRASIGGAISVTEYGSLNITHSRVRGNIATDGGGGIHATYLVAIYMANTTVAGNTASEGNGGAFQVPPSVPRCHWLRRGAVPSETLLSARGWCGPLRDAVVSSGVAQSP
ncbi:hypothetical protein CYMTET_36136 [Cymbomonas tetramitiformis]|uniref:Right handed beta helix domain-containing protein n=1 Tax=Cymbomonas tetramitiformis TaxID=36881 RepID=A0AAE0CGJ8_9CHLO|nr:hypothetical protein CYMTET_36136 [Cymbomonas tetramitiformis]